MTKFGEWAHCIVSRNLCIFNYWRYPINSYDEDEEICIGLRVQTAAHINDCIWHFDVFDLPQDETALYFKVYKSMYGEKEYRYHQLDEAKKDIDRVIDRVNSLLLFS